MAHFETRLRAVVPLFNTLADDFTNGKPQPMWPCVRHALTAFEDWTWAGKRLRVATKEYTVLTRRRVQDIGSLRLAGQPLQH